MTDNPEGEQHYSNVVPFFPGGRRLRRRLKRWQGASWTPPTLSSEPKDGRFCKLCGKWHGYMTLGTAYEKRGEAWVLMWKCPKWGHVVDELWLGETDP